MIRADLNQIPCGSSNRRNRDILSCVLVCLFLFGCVTVRLCGSELVSVRLLMVFCADLATSLCGQFVFKFPVLGGYFLHVLMFLVFSRQ